MANTGIPEPAKMTGVISSFSGRRPWAVGLVFLVLGPFLGMLYLNQGLISLVYLCLVILSEAGLFLIPPATVFSLGPFLLWIINLPVVIIGLIHGVSIARRRLADEPIRWFARWWTVVAILVFTPVSTIAFSIFLFQPFDARSSSMSPTINTGDYFFASKFGYIDGAPSRGEIVVVRIRNSDYVKRVIGLPGDRVQMIEGKLNINGLVANVQPDGKFFGAGCAGYECPTDVVVESPPGGASYRVITPGVYGPYGNTPLVTVPTGEYFVLNDNRESTSDSRFTGFIRSSAVVGKVAHKFVDGRTNNWTWSAIR